MIRRRSKARLVRTMAIAIIALAWFPSSAHAAVSRDCFYGELSITCALNRVDEAKDIDRLLRPILERRNWNWGCYEVQYIRGDDGRPDIILVSVNGIRSAKPPMCGSRYDDKGAGAMSEGELGQVGRDLKAKLLGTPRTLRNELLRKVRTLILTNGWGAEVTINLS